MRRLVWATMAIGVMVAAASGSVRADVLLSGPDSNDGTYSTTALSLLATSGDTVNDSGSGLTGISVWGLLGGANASSPTSPVYGAITTSTPAGDNGKNAIFRYYLLATNGSGAQSVVSLGEIDPNFGGTAATPAFIAFQATGGGLLGAPGLVVPGAPGRDLSNLTSLQLLAVAALPNPGEGIESTSVQLSGNVTNPGSYTLPQLQTDITPVKEIVSGDTYPGVPLWTFLDSSNSNVTSQIVVTQATDGYEVVLSLAEIDPSLGGNPNDLLPYADTGGNFPGDGVARTILPTDNFHGRWESNLDAVQVESVPEPGSLSLLGAAVVSVTIFNRRRRARIAHIPG
jgi:hypothetical protein